MTGESTLPSEKRRRLDRVTAACDLCKRRKVKCDGEQPCAYCRRKNHAETCSFSAPRTRGQATNSPGYTPNYPSGHRSTGTTPHATRDRAHSESASDQPRNRIDADANRPVSSASPTASRDDYHEDTAVPLEGRIVRDAQGKVIFIGDCAPLSFLQTVRHLIPSEAEPDGFSVPAARDCIIESARPSISDRPQDISIDIRDVTHLINKYLFTTSGLVELFERDELEKELKNWARGTTSHTDDAAAAVFFLVLAIGAQDDHEAKAEAWFQHARDILLKNMCSSMNVSTVQGFTLVAIYMMLAFQPNGAYLYFCMPSHTFGV